MMITVCRKKYWVRPGSIAYDLISGWPAILAVLTLIIVTGLGNHFIDGM